MRRTLLIAGGIAVAGYVLGTRANRPVLHPRESVRHQLERLWNDPKARKRRERQIAQLQKDGKKTAKRVAKVARQRAKDGEKTAQRLTKAAKRRTKALGR